MFADQYRVVCVIDADLHSYLELYSRPRVAAMRIEMSPVTLGERRLFLIS